MTDCQLCTVPTDNTTGVCGFCTDYQPPSHGDTENKGTDCDLLAGVNTPDGVTAGQWRADADRHLVRTLSDGRTQRGNGDITDYRPGKYQLGDKIGTTEALVVLFDGKLAELDICNPCWFYAGRLTDPDTGTSWRYVYRSTAAKISSKLFRPALDWLDGAAPIGSAQLAADPDMMFGTGELTLWEA